jgi:hypothetical protein
VHATLGRGLFVLLDCHFLLLKIHSRPSSGAFTFRVHCRQRQAQQHFILYQTDKIQGLSDQNRVTVGQRIQPFQLGLVARQVQRALDLNRMLQGAQATLTGQLNLAAYRQAQRHAAPLVRLSVDSTEERALRKFMGKARKRRHIRVRFPRLRIPAKTPGINLNGLKHGAPD